MVILSNCIPNNTLKLLYRIAKALMPGTLIAGGGANEADGIAIIMLWKHLILEILLVVP